MAIYAKWIKSTLLFLARMLDIALCIAELTVPTTQVTGTTEVTTPLATTSEGMCCLLCYAPPLAIQLQVLMFEVLNHII